MMKVVMVDSLVGNDYTVWLCRGLAKAGIEVVLICSENRKDLQEEFLVLPVSPVKGTGQYKILKLFKYIYYLFWLFFYLLRSNADIIHYQFFRRERIECLYFPLLRLLNKQLIFTAHNILPHEAHAIDYYLRYLVYKAANKIIVHNLSIRENLLSKYRIPAERVHVVPAVKSVSGVQNVSVTRAVARDHFQLSENEKVLLFFGYIREYKGFGLLLEAFDLAGESIENLKLIVAGKAQTDELLEQYQAQIRQMKHADSVIFKPEFISKEDVDYYFRAADALAVPYKRIDYSGVLQESFAYGLPVLATNVGNFKEVIQDGINGYTTNLNTPKDFAQIIERAFQDMSALSRMGEAAYAIDQNYPNWEVIGLLTAALYHQDLPEHTALSRA